MKIGRLIDLIGQGIIAGLILIGGVWNLLNGDVEQIGVGAMWGAMFLGPWQLISCFLTIILGTPLRRLRIIHIAGSVVYIVIFSLMLSHYGNDYLEGAAKLGFNLVMFGIPTVLAIFYMYITYRSLRME